MVVGIGFYTINQTIAPSVKRVVEDTLADTSLVLAQVYQPFLVQYLSGDTTAFDKLSINHTPADVLTTPILYHQKKQSQYHIYITNNTGLVVYDSHNKAQIGDDFSRWNDVYLTLQGKYGARSSDDKTGVSVMYVASPIKYNGQIIGVVSTGKSVATLEPYINLTKNEITKIIVQITLLGVLLTALIAWWLRHSIYKVNIYTQSLASTRRPHFYLAQELNGLTYHIEQMKNAIENKAYVTEYVHTLTHELKSPLTAIRASSELLNDELSSDDRAMFCAMISEQTDKMTVFIDKLLTLARLEQPNFKITKTTIMLYPFMENIHNQLKTKLAVLNRSLIHFIEPNAKIYGDAFWLSQAMTNVLDNAIFYGEGQIAIDFYDDTLWVVNTSKKLPDYVIQRAFERYFSQNLNTHHHANGKVSKGSGLGLALVREIMARHNGQASFDCFGKDNPPKLSANLQHFVASQNGYFVIVGLTFQKLA